MSIGVVRLALAVALALPLAGVLLNAPASAVPTHPCGAITVNPDCGPVAREVPPSSAPDPDDDRRPRTYSVQSLLWAVGGATVPLAFCNGNASDLATWDTAVSTTPAISFWVDEPGSDPPRHVGASGSTPFELRCRDDHELTIPVGVGNYPVTATRVSLTEWLAFCDGNASVPSTFDDALTTVPGAGTDPDAGPVLINEPGETPDRPVGAYSKAGPFTLNCDDTRNPDGSETPA